MALEEAAIEAAAPGVGPLDGPLDLPLDPDEVWNELHREPRFFTELTLATDGGFSEVPALFTRDRFLTALLCFVFLWMNLYFLLVPNIGNLMTMGWFSDSTEDRYHLRHLLLTWLLECIIGRRLRAKVVLATLELGLLVVLLRRVPLHLWQVWRGRTPAARWHGVRRLLWSDVADVMTFSSMRLLNFVTPSIFFMQLNNEVQKAKGEEWPMLVFILVRFMSRRIICAFVGLEAFMIKFMDTAGYIQADQSASGWDSMFYSVAFLNQVLGIVQVSPLLQKRLFVFLFGGEDCYLSKRERIVEQTWCSMVVQRIWEESQSKGPTALLWFFAVMLSYSDYDFQSLTLNERSRSNMPSPAMPSFNLNHQGSWSDPRGEAVLCRCRSSSPAQSVVTGMTWQYCSESPAILPP